MTYTIDLHFQPAVPRQRILGYFAARRRFRVADNEISYGNADTGAYFFLDLRPARLFRDTITGAEFIINYFRPSFFALEAEIELSSFMAEFKPLMHDPQMDGMGDGPYSGPGFLKGWNFGNQFSVRSALSRGPDRQIFSMPAETLRAVWTWNYRLAERRERLNDRCFVPTITFSIVEERLSRVAVWPLGMPVLLPKVDYVLVGRMVSGEKRYGLAPWLEVEDVVRRTGFDTAQDSLDLRYLATPPEIARWVADIPLIDAAALLRLSAREIFDDEVLDAARAQPPIENV